MTMVVSDEMIVITVIMNDDVDSDELMTKIMLVMR